MTQPKRCFGLVSLAWGTAPPGCQEPGWDLICAKQGMGAAGVVIGDG